MLFAWRIALKPEWSALDWLSEGHSQRCLLRISTLPGLLKTKKKRFCLLRNSTGITVEIKRHKVFVGRRQHRGDSLGQMDHGDVYIFSFLKDHYRKVLSRRCSPRRLLSLSKIQGSLEENKALEIILKSTAEMWGSKKPSSPDGSLRGVFIKRSPLFFPPRTSRQWRPAEWILVPCAQQAAVTTKPLIISWQKPKGIILLSSVLCH